ncbi:DODA-type extradiol aromatic ring-opening family dioxygenase [Calidifontibacillus oryziterrae]|uniref:DODA-type extradiol aromatic ring-opening family dioxygenase n=1 Tax=Calidifontibacillus oryziterrae TaxID=1191699 RepID=UPI0002E73B18|nr:class III extradiol ring-cleavage dioxygenase [Calidifontibacillus oryziterrae]
MLPAYFIAHGSPTLAIESNEYTQFLTSLGKELPKPKAVILFSAHWLSDVQKVSQVDDYDTIYDFYGFPDEMYQIKYPAKGDRNLTEQIKQLFLNQGIHFDIETKRGLDHGAWVVLRLLFPSADVPVISMSVNPKLSPEEQYKIGKALAELRADNVLIIASGGTVHNLRALRWGNQQGDANQWAVDFDDWLKNHLHTWDTQSLFRYDSIAPNAHIAVPPAGNEHFVPLFYAMGSADHEKSANLIHRSYQYGSLSHSVWQFGEI